MIINNFFVFNRKISSGFTLIELLIAMTIIGILVAIAVPSYQNYTRRAYFTEVVQAVAPYKLGVEECFQMQDDLLSCQGGKNGVPMDILAGTGPGIIDSITTKGGGMISITPRGKHGIEPSDTYVLTPQVDNGSLSWTSSGGAVEKGYAN